MALASLSSALLARKGQARPAMRPQGYANVQPSPTQLEDLGWNDLGADVTPIAPTVQPDPKPAPPPVLAEREALVEAVRPVSVATAGRLRRETAHAGRAAFTLRLDADRHLKLRLASAVCHRSAQRLVQHALDRFLDTLPEVDALVAQLPATPPQRRKRR